MSNIPAARDILEDLLEQWEDLSPKEVKLGLDAALSMMTRTVNKPRSKNSSVKVDAALIAKVRTRYGYLKSQGIEPPNQQLADEFNVNPGRVSEILAGKV